VERGKLMGNNFIEFLSFMGFNKVLEYYEIDLIFY